MASVKYFITLFCLHDAIAQDIFANLERPTFTPFGQVKLTSERGGPPAGAEFVPIRVVNISDNLLALSRKPSSRPMLGRPPPPPPKVTPQPTKKPRPRPSAPVPLPIPVPSNQGIPQRPQKVPGRVPTRPHGQLVVPVTEERPDLEVVGATTASPPTTTPNSADHLPAYYHRFLQNEDGSYYFDFAAPNSVQRLEQGFFKHDNLQDAPVHVKSGAYSFISPEGFRFRVDYVADERGYRPFSLINF